MGAGQEAHPHWGAKKLLVVLESRYPEVEFPCAGTIHNILDRAGLVKKRRRRKGLGQETSQIVSDAPNTVLCVDYKGWFRLGDGSVCHPLTMLDSYSRYLLCCKALSGTDMRSAFVVFDEVFREYGLPEVLRSDNGIPFAGTGAGRLTQLAVWLLKLGIVLDRIRPGHPEENGRQERMHRTLKAETTRPRSFDLPGQQVRFDAFRREYNEERPHEALGQVPPGQLYRPSPRSYTGDAPDPEYPGHFEIRSVKQSGEIWWRGKRYFISEALQGERVGLFEVEDGIWWVVFASHHVAVYDGHKDKVLPVRSGVGRRKLKSEP